MKVNRQNLLNILILNHKLNDFYKIFACIHTECQILLNTEIGEEKRKEQANGKLEELFSRPLKSAHLRNIVRKQYPADFFNKPQKSPHGSFEVVCGGS